MKLKFVFLSLASLVLAGLLSACSGGAFAASGWPGIVASQDTVYLASNTSIYALNLTNGSRKWSFPAEPDNSTTFFSDPSLTADGQLIVGSYNNTLYSINSDNGAQNWVFDQAEGRFIGSQLVTGGMIYAPNSDNSLYALNEQGMLSWKFEAEDALWARPSGDGEQVFFPSMDHNLYSVDGRTGQRQWSEALGGASVGSPSLSEDGRLYLGTFANEMLALDASTGDILWKAPTQGWVWSGPAVDGERLYFGDLNGFVYALDRETGQELWRVQPDGPIAGTPLVTEDALYLTVETGSLIALDHDGNPLWTQTVGGKLYTRPVAAGDLILVAPLESEELLIALDTNGARRWSFSLQ
jgi:outer membrane protein assembly factor BamB